MLKPIFDLKVNHRAALKTALIYAVFGSLWIVLSDTLVTDVLKVPESIEYGQTIKGLFYVFLTASLVFFLVQKYIHEILLAKEVISEGEDHFKVALNAANMSTWKYYPKDKLFLADEKFLEIHSIISKDFTLPLESIFSLIENEFHQPFTNFLKDFNNNKSVSVEYKIKTPSNEIRWINLTGRYIKEGKSRNFIGVARNITKKKSESSKLKLSEERLSLALEITNDGLWDWDAVSGNFYLSPRCFTMLGYKTNEIPFSLDTLLKLVHPDDLYLFGNLKNKKPEEIFVFNYLEYRVETKNGNYIWIINRVKVIERNNNGEPLRILGTMSDITDRKNAENKLLQRNEFIEAILGNIPVGLSVCNVNDGSILYVNKRIEDIFGWKFYTNNNKTKFVDIFPELVSSNADLFDLISSNLLPDNNQFEIKRSDNTTRTISIKNHPLLKQDILITTVIDLTEEIQAQKKLQTSEEKFRNIFKEADIPMIIVDELGKIIESNKSFNLLAGYTGEEINSLKSFAELVHPSDISSIMFWFQKLVNGELNFSPASERRIINSSGEIIWTKINSSAIRDTENKFIYTIITIIDITASKKAEEETRKLYKAVEQSPSSILITNNYGIIEYANPVYLSSSGFLKSEIIGSSLLEIVFPGSSETFLSDIFNAIKKGKEYKCDFSRVKSNEQMIWELITISPIKDKDGESSHMLIIIENITERKEVETKLIKAKENAEKADKLKFDFLTQMSHEIRTPINSILSYLSLIKSNIGAEKSLEIDNYFNTINNNSNRLIRTIESFLHMSDLMSDTYKTNFTIVDIESLLKNIMQEYKKISEQKGIELVLVNEFNVHELKLDENSVIGIFSNLIDNAVKYTQAGGVKIRLYKNGHNKICVDIIDTGIGMSDEHLKDLFRPFIQEDMGLSRIYDGNGLGLAIAKKYAELNSAVINVSSTKGKGSIFTVIFNN